MLKDLVSSWVERGLDVYNMLVTVFYQSGGKSFLGAVTKLDIESIKIEIGAV